ncbi:hypothetical protein ACIPD2_39620 [Streptomyces griseofuscus]|uniref:hypothetical protein n=1 Tax=Streptomyces griseofuscus TaxID=146922 RepID=UPI0038110587
MHSGDFTALTRELDRVMQSGSAPGITAAGPLRFTDPRPQTGRTQATGRTRGWYGGGTESGLTTVQREAIGYVGEWYAYQWLCARLRLPGRGARVQAVWLSDGGQGPS